MKYGFIYDLDGVLVDTVDFHFDSWKKLANSLGFKIGDNIKESLKGISRMDSLDIVLAEGGYKADHEEKLKLAERKNQWYVANLQSADDSVILSGVMTFIARCKESHIPMSIGSASKNAQTIISKTSLKGEFTRIVGGNDVKNAKPDPEVFLLGAESLGLPPEQCIVFEDSLKGLEAAGRGGFKSVGIGKATNLPIADIVIENLENIHPKTIIELVT